MDHGCASGVTAGLENSVLESGLASGAAWSAVAFEFGGTRLSVQAAAATALEGFVVCHESLLEGKTTRSDPKCV